MQVLNDPNTPVDTRQLINLAPQSDPVPLIDLAPTTDGIPVSPDIAAPRAAKAVLGLPDVGKTYDQVLQDIQSGNEDKFRKQAASHMDFQKAQAASNLISATASASGPLSLEDAQFVRETAAKAFEATDPGSVIEEAYGKHFTTQLDKSAANMQDTDYQDENNANPVAAQKIRDITASSISKTQYAQKLLEDNSKTLDNQSWAGFGVDLLKQAFPGYTDVKIRSNTGSAEEFKLGLGPFLRERTRELLRLPFTKYKAEVDKIYATLNKDNPQLANTFLSAIVGQSTDDEFLNTSISVGDAAGIYGIGKTVARISLGATKKAASSLIKAAATSDPPKVAMAKGAGDLAEAAVQKTTSNVLEDFKGTSNPTTRAVEALPSILKGIQEDIKANPGIHGQDLINRLDENINSLNSDFFKAVTEVSKVQRIPGAIAFEDTVRLYKDRIVDLYAGKESNILNVSSSRYDPLTNTYWANIDFGQQDGTYFAKKITAKKWAAENGYSNYPIENLGLGYFIRKEHPFNETDHVIREGLLKIPEAVTPDSVLNNFLGYIRTPNDVLSKGQIRNRATAVYSPSVLTKVAYDNAQEIQKLAKRTLLPGTKRSQRWDEWERVVKSTQTMNDPDTNLPGYFFKHPAELDDHYLRNIGRMPDDQEVAAYFAFRTNLEMDAMLRELAIYKNKMRVGTEQHRFTALDEKGKSVASAYFDGVVRDHLPLGGDDTMMFAGRNRGDEKFYDGEHIMSTKDRKIATQEVKEGKLKVIELYDPETKPLSGFSDATEGKRIRYVVVPNAETKPITVNQLPRRGGGHIEYDHEFNIKQADIDVQKNGKSVFHWYVGDKTHSAVDHHATGVDISNKLNQARILIKGGKTAEAKAFVEANFSIPWKKFKADFEHSYGEGGVKVAARFNKDEPFRLVRKGETILGIDKTMEKRFAKKGDPTKTTFKDGTKQGSLARQYQVQYTGQRDAENMQALTNTGTREAPYYTTGPAKTIDPIPMMNRGLGRIINSAFMDDYKIYSVEHWLREAAPWLEKGEDFLQHAPFHHFQKPEFKKDAPADIVNKLKLARFQVQQLVGTPDKVGTMLEATAQKLSDAIYNYRVSDKVPFIGGKRLPLAADPSWLLPRITDPFKLARKLVMHEKLGLFNLPQFLVQSMTYVNILGIAGPKHAVSGTVAAQLHFWSTVNRNPAIMDYLDSLANKMHVPGTSRWKIGELKESIQEMERAGFGNIGSTYALLDDPLSNKVFTNGRDKFLDAGLVPFKWGERNSRYGAWHTAYREFRDANPTGRITDVDRAKILERAALLNVNMDRSSNSLLQHGALSIPAQFYTYQMRLADLMLGKRLTPVERARMFVTNAAFYGIPTAVGSYTVYPFGDSIKRYAQEHGYVVGDNFITSILSEGGLAGIGAWVTGGGDTSKGHWFNFGDRYGTKGVDSLESLVRGDKTFWEIAGGAALGSFFSGWQSTDGFRMAMQSILKDGDEYFPLGMDDFTEPLKEIAAINAGWRLAAAAHTGSWLSRKGISLEDNISFGKALFQTLTGLQDQNTSNLQIISGARKDEAAMQKYGLDRFVEEGRKGVRINLTDPTQATKYFQRARAMLIATGVPVEKWAQAISMISKDTSLTEDMYKSFGLNNVPEGLKDTRTDAYIRRLQLQENKGK